MILMWRYRDLDASTSTSGQVVPIKGPNFARVGVILREFGYAALQAGLHEPAVLNGVLVNVCLSQLFAVHP